MSYRIIDVSGDIGIRAEGKTLEECFIESALGLYSLITDLETVDLIEEIEINLTEQSIEDLLICFLNELIFQFDAYGFVGKSVFLLIDETSLHGKIKGEIFNPQKHERRLLVKAATYHNLKLKRENSHFIAEIIFDI